MQHLQASARHDGLVVVSAEACVLREAHRQPVPGWIIAMRADEGARAVNQFTHRR